jgi:hypothetical protein
MIKPSAIAAGMAHRRGNAKRVGVAAAWRNA